MTSDDLSDTSVRKICTVCSREFTSTIVQCPHDGSMLTAMGQDRWLGKTLDNRYQIQKVIGSGGMGIVYLGNETAINRDVAIKMLRAQLVSDTTSAKRFTREARLAARLSHPNIIITHAYGMSNDYEYPQPYMVLELLQGVHIPARSLTQEIRDHDHISVEHAIHIFQQACSALHYAHRQGVIHRDVKPGNIMIVPIEEDPYHVKVVDFGVAKLLPLNAITDDGLSLTRSGEVCGSPTYMSPEQCCAEGIDARSDIYSMGIVIYEALTGKVPFLGKNMVETMTKHLKDKPPSFNSMRPDLFIPERLEQVVMTALSKEPYQRQQTMAELAQALEMSVPRHGQKAAIHIFPTLEHPSSPSASWLAPALIAACAVVLLIISGLAWLVFTRTQPVLTVPVPAITRPTPALTKPGQIVTPPVATPSATVSPVVPSEPLNYGSIITSPPRPHLIKSQPAKTVRLQPKKPTVTRPKPEEAVKQRFESLEGLKSTHRHNSN